MEVKEIISDFKESFLDRIKNPFVLLYLISWTGWNWLLVYEVFTFPAAYSLGKRIAIINGYIQHHLWGNLTLFPLWSAFVGACIFIPASAVFLLMFSWFQRTLRPKIYAVSAQDDNIPRRLYNALHNRYDRLKKDFDDSKKLWAEYDEVKDELDSKVNTLQTQKLALELNNQKINSQIETLKSQLRTEEIDKTNNEDIFHRTFVNDRFWIITDEPNSKVSNTYKLRFDKSNNVFNESNYIAWVVRDIEFFADNQVVKFRLLKQNDLRVFKTHVLFNMGEGSFKGVEILHNGVKMAIQYRPSIPATQ